MGSLILKKSSQKMNSSTLTILVFFFLTIFTISECGDAPDFGGIFSGVSGLLGGIGGLAGAAGGKKK
ncbi:unnamed protein product [Caenorhabditis nigoni]